VAATKHDLPTVDPGSRAGWDAWLAAHHETSDGVWLKLAKKGVEGVSYAEAVEVALCYGWIDGHARALDERYWLQRYTPRRPSSRWSKINRDRALGLIERGAMKPAGLREVERAQADGRWDAAYDGQSSATVPDDLAAALDADPRARAFFDTLNASNRYSIVYRVNDAKRPETRARRIAKYVAMCAAGEKIYP
jgi:uncharacterized protein YdeI (YjbR/CyaY-like superfamily)